MAENEWPDSRFLLPDMFSFSFEPEVLTFLWGLCAKKVDDIQLDYRQLIPKATLLQVFVPVERHRASLLTFFRYSAVTSSTVVLVGLSSYTTFKVLQKLRYEGFNGLKKAVLNIGNYLRTPRRFFPARNLELVLRRRSDSKRNDILKRPSELVLSGSSNGASPANSLRNRLNGNHVPTDNFSVTPINGEIASGDEDVAEVQGQYFGPLGAGLDITPRRTVAAFIITPTSPESGLGERYKSLQPPCFSSTPPPELGS